MVFPHLHVCCRCTLAVHLCPRPPLSAPPPLPRTLIPSSAYPSLSPSPQDEHSRLCREASVGVNGYVLVFSVASRVSFEKVRV